MKRIAIIANCGKLDAASVMERVRVCSDRLGIELFTCDATTDLLPDAIRIEPAELSGRVDAVMALGGDGTLLNSVRMLDCTDIPVIGVNLGSLGFMTSVPQENLEKTLEALRYDKTESSSRTMTSCWVESNGRESERWVALNDVVIGWGSSSRIVTMDIAVHGDNVLTSLCDGLIVSTPTGSTGHSMSAGGPIIHPESSVFAISMICPHTLSNRPLVIPDKFAIDIRITSSSKSILLAVDGADRCDLNERDIVHLERCPKGLQLLHLPEYRYFDILKQKLHWRGSVV